MEKPSFNLKINNYPKQYKQHWLNQREKLSLKTPTWPRTCNKTPSTAPTWPWRNTTLRKILPHSSRKSLTASTTPPGTPSLEGTSDPMWHTRQSTSSISTWDKLPFYSSNLVDRMREGSIMTTIICTSLIKHLRIWSYREIFATYFVEYLIF